MAVTGFLGFFFPWGMPFFFLISGTSSWFALRRRTAGQYAAERFARLFIPYLAGSILLSPLMLYFEWRHLAITGEWQGSYLDFVLLHRVGFSPQWFGEVGFHLWFLGFLFCFSLICLPLFLWLKGESGQLLISRVARICTRPGGILLFILPLLVVRLGLQPFFPREHDWADFLYLMTFFSLGFVLYAHKGFKNAIRRDWLILLVVAILSTVAWAYLAITAESLDVFIPPSTIREFALWTAVTINGWCWAAFILFIGMRYLDFSNRWLQYSQGAALPFFVLHQPVIMAVAFYVVQWDAGITLKMLAVVAGSFVLTLAIYDLVIRRIVPLRVLFGMKGAVKTAAVQPQETTQIIH